MLDNVKFLRRCASVYDCGGKQVTWPVHKYAFYTVTICVDLCCHANPKETQIYVLMCAAIPTQQPLVRVAITLQGELQLSVFVEAE